MGKYSGLGPAVEAHLKRWKRIDREWRYILAETAKREPDETGNRGKVLPLNSHTHPEVAYWLHFGASWGIPQPDGNVAKVVRAGVSPDGVEQFQSYLVTDETSIHGKEQFPDEITLSQALAATNLMEYEWKQLSAAETIYVAGEITDRVSYAAEEMEAEPLYLTDLIAPSGFMVLEKPVNLIDLHPDTGEVSDQLYVAIRAIGWTTIDQIWKATSRTDLGADSPYEGQPHPGIMIYMYTTPDDWRDSYRRVWRKMRAAGEVEDYASGNPWGLTEPTMEGRARDALVPLDVMPWSLGTNWFTGPDINEPGAIDGPVFAARRWFLTLMRFAWQRIIVADREPITRKAFDRISRYRPKPATEYSVLRLRRVEGRRSDETGTGFKLLYRSKTRGHWRRVHVPTLGPARLEDGTFNSESHRLKWIDPYWRGPEDGPLGPQHKATVIVR